MRGQITVLPEKYSEKNLVTSVMGVINDYIPLSNTRSCGSEEQVFWAKFEEIDIRDIKENIIGKLPLILSIGTCKSFYIWGLSYEGKATLLFSERNSYTLNAKFLPNPKTGDKFSDKRPVLALLDSVSRACFQWQLRFLSLRDYKSVYTLRFESRTVNIDANDRFIIVGRIDSITVLSAQSFVEYFTIAGVKPTVWPNNAPKDMPYALGSRWLAFTDLKPIYHQLSRCGDASTDESQPLTSTMMNMNKRIWSSLSALAGTVVPGSSLSGTSGTSPSNKPCDPTRSGGLLGPSGDNNYPISSDGSDSNLLDSSPGYVTVVDLFLLDKRYRTWKQLETTISNVNLSVLSSSEDPTTPIPETTTNDPFGSDSISGTNYLNVHDHAGAGSLVAHFMAHRWASVALLKFDPTGTLLFTACTRGHTFNLFRISNHPCDQRQTAVHHLYILERGNIPCEVVDATFSRDSRWLAVSSNHGTTHVFPITAYGGAITVRTHTRPYVVNRTSRYHRSSGIEEHQLTRPQRDRTTLDTSSTTGGIDHTGMLGGGNVLGPDASSLNTCQCAPMAGLAPQCPHLTIATPLPSGEPTPGSLVRLGSSNALGSLNTDTPPARATTASYRACACPPNAMYNTTNSRLPPYPEPCQIKPQARLRPHTAANATTGAAATALGAASGAFEVVTTGSGLTIAHSRQTMLGSSPSASGYGYMSHMGPCAHFPAPRPAQFASSQPNRPYCQPLPIVDHHELPSFPYPFSGAIMAACFSPPVCFLPQHPRQSNSITDYRRDPYGCRSRAVDALFILTNNLYLVEFDLCVGPAELAAYGEKLYQDGSIRLDCTPVGEWNLRTDAVYLPPFPRDHPFMLTNSPTTASRFSSSEKMGTSDTIILETSHSFADEPDSSVPESNNPSESYQMDLTKPSVDSSILDEDLGSSTAAASHGWTAEDAASYWYSQVEITTHLGPLRRVWKGPQFAFKSYSKLSEIVPDCEVTTSLPAEIRAPLFETLASSEAHKLLPPLSESNWMNHYYSEWRPDLDISELSELSSSLNVSSRSSLRGTMMVLPETRMCDGTSPVRSYTKNPGKSRLPSGRLIDGSPALRWRNRSGEGTRPVSIAGPIGASGDASDAPIYIEGGSYHDSSLGGSLSSLMGRSADDVASYIADAMQDEESNWSQNRSGLDTSLSATPVVTNQQNASVRTTPSTLPVRQLAVDVQSALSEADFPSQDTSPSAGNHAPMLEPFVLDPVIIPATPTPAPDPNTSTLQQEQQQQQQPSDMDKLVIPKLEVPIKTGKKTKRSKRLRAKAHKSGTLSASEYPGDGDGDAGGGGGEIEIICSKKYHSAMTSPCISGTDSLSSSPAVVEGFHQQGRKKHGRRTVSATLEQSSLTSEMQIASSTVDEHDPALHNTDGSQRDQTLAGEEGCEDQLVKESTLVTGDNNDCQVNEPGTEENVPHTDETSPDNAFSIEQPEISEGGATNEAPSNSPDAQHFEN